MFFRIERSGPLGGGPARANPRPGSAIRAMITACYRGNGCVLFARLDFPYFRTIRQSAAAFARDSLGPPVRVNLPARAAPSGVVAFPRRVFHVSLPVASPHSHGPVLPAACSLSSHISLLSSTERGMLPVRRVRRARGPTTNPHADTLGSRPSHAASRQPLRGERFAPSEFPPIFGSCLHEHSPLRAPDSALCSSARCLPNRPS